MKKLLFLFCLVSQLAFGAAVPVDAIWAGLFDNSGQPLSGGLVYSYTAGTTSAKTTWSDSAKSSANANPVVLDAYGRAMVFGDGLYKFVVKTSAGVTLYTVDNVELLTTISPTNLTVTNLTVSSGTVANLYSSHGVISDQLISSTTISTAYLSAPTIVGATISSATLTTITVSGATATALTVTSGNFSGLNLASCTVNTQPSASNGIANKDYVDTEITSHVKTMDYSTVVEVASTSESTYPIAEVNWAAITSVTLPQVNSTDAVYLLNVKLRCWSDCATDTYAVCMYKLQDAEGNIYDYKATGAYGSNNDGFTLTSLVQTAGGSRVVYLYNYYIPAGPSSASANGYTYLLSDDRWYNYVQVR